MTAVYSSLRELSKAYGVAMEVSMHCTTLLSWRGGRLFSALLGGMKGCELWSWKGRDVAVEAHLFFLGEEFARVYLL